jgi:hypothetical protein
VCGCVSGVEVLLFVKPPEKMEGETLPEGLENAREVMTKCWIKKVILEKTEVSFTMENILYLY